jgi:hypothetical protein
MYNVLAVKQPQATSGSFYLRMTRTMRAPLHERRQTFDQHHREYDTEQCA